MAKSAKASAAALLRTVGKYVVAYLAWLVGALLGGYALLKLWETITGVYRLLFPGSWGYGAVYMFSIVIIGLAWLVGALLLEDHYRKGLAAGLLAKRVMRITIGELVALAVVLPARFLVH